MERPVKDPLIGTTLDDKFRLIERTGQGATSSVYKAEELSTSNFVAIKVLHAHLCENESLVARFQREAQAAAILVHPNIVHVKEYGVSVSGTPYLVMDYVYGISLQEKLSKDGWFPVSVALPIFKQICAALNVAHQAGIVHRDLKPGNIMLIEQSENTYLVKVLDFGCAMVVPLLGDTVLKVTQTGEMLGSLLYMSPEQCLDQDVDARSDCYALACVLYETLTGKPPLSARTAFETMNKQMSVMPDNMALVRPDLKFDPKLEKIILKAMAKSPAKRYQTIVEFFDELSTVSADKFSMDVDAKSTHLHEVKKLVARQHKIDQFWKVYWPFILIAFTVVSVCLEPVFLPIIAFVFALCVFKATSDELIAIHRLHSLKKIVDDCWRVYWPYFFLVGVYYCIKFTSLLFTVVAIGFAIKLVRVLASEQKLTLESKDSFDDAPTNIDLHSHDLAYRLAHLSPLAKIEITVVGARKSFTYSSGDKLISLDVSFAANSQKLEIIVRPVFQKSFYWDTICEEYASANESGNSFAVPAYATKSTDNNWIVIVIKANQATIVEVVDKNRSQVSEQEDTISEGFSESAFGLPNDAGSAEPTVDH